MDIENYHKPLKQTYTFVCLLYYSAHMDTPLLPVRSCKIYKALTAFAHGRIFCHYHAVARDLDFCSFTQKDKQEYMYRGPILTRIPKDKSVSF